MRIQHNIPAMSSYRNYTNNTSALAKNLEKLSSGYKINRAGDDAAGLAISEKMRAQISGLEQAQSNAKSGINLVQTAEGALTEVHDMLNRMVTLAEQSANGTYDNEVDRVQLQKEVSQLKSEIDRIADSANFNGIKLLDGSMDAEDVVSVKDATIKGLTKITTMQDRFGKNMGSTNAAYDTAIAGATGAAAKDYRHKDALEAGKTEFKYDLQNGGWNVKQGTAAVQLELFGTSQTTTDEVQSLKLSTTVNIAEDGTLSADEAIKQIYDSIQPNDAGKKVVYLAMPQKGKAAADAPSTDAEKIEYEVSMENGELKFTMTDKGYATACARSGDSSDVSQFIGHFNVILTAWQDGTGAAGTPVDATATTQDNKLTAFGLNDCCTNEINVGRANAVTQLAEAFVGFNGAGMPTVKDGTGLKVGDQYYVWGCTDKTVNGKYGDNVTVVDVRDLCDKDGNLKLIDNGTLRQTLNEALSRFTVAAKDNEMWSVGLTQNGDALMFTERVDNPSDADLTTVEGIQNSIRQFTGIVENVDTKKATGKALTLQIGDTAETFNQMKVNISDMHAASMGIGDIDISTQEGASEAMAKIKDAINYVSDVRGTLGATQNRLDHTINNLSVMRENIQDAESTIRDVDIAQEMMDYTKNSILVQSAQAMLAQANQMPQGVLQLLQ